MRVDRTLRSAKLALVATLVLTACGEGTTSSASMGADPTASTTLGAAAPASAVSTTSSASQPEPQIAIVDPPVGLLPPGSVARVTADNLRVRDGAPGDPAHAEVIHTLNAGDVVLVEWSPLAYVPPSEATGRYPWYAIHVGGNSVNAAIDGGVHGWVAAGNSGLEFLELQPVTCRSERDLPNLIYAPFMDGDQESLATPWERLACNGDHPLAVAGVFDHVCPEGGVYPYRFSPNLASPIWCSAMLIDDFDTEGFARYGHGLVTRFSEFTPSDPERGDVLELRGHFDDADAERCTAETHPGFQGRPVDPEFLRWFCREQFVPDDWDIVDHRELAPLPWAG